VAYKHAITIGQQAFHIFNLIDQINPNFFFFCTLLGSTSSIMTHRPSQALFKPVIYSRKTNSPIESHRSLIAIKIILAQANS